jgi:hypothetical protein
VTPRVAALLGAALPALALLASCARDHQNTLPGTLERDRVELVADADEFIIALPFAEGAAVKVGDVVVVQDGASSMPLARSSRRPRRASTSSGTARCRPRSAPRRRGAIARVPSVTTRFANVTACSVSSRAAS